MSAAMAELPVPGPTKPHWAAITSLSAEQRHARIVLIIQRKLGSTSIKPEDDPSFAYRHRLLAGFGRPPTVSVARGSMSRADTTSLQQQDAISAMLAAVPGLQAATGSSRDLVGTDRSGSGLTGINESAEDDSNDESEASDSSDDGNDDQDLLDSLFDVDGIAEAYRDDVNAVQEDVKEQEDKEDDRKDAASESEADQDDHETREDTGSHLNTTAGAHISTTRSFSDRTNAKATLTELEAAGKKISNKAQKRLDEGDTCACCGDTLTRENAYFSVDKVKKTHIYMSHDCFECQAEYARLRTATNPSSRFSRMVAARARNINRDVGRPLFSGSSVWQRAWEGSTRPSNALQAVRSAMINVYNAGAAGIRGDIAFFRGTSPREEAMFVHNLDSAAYFCAATGVALTASSGDGSNRISVDRSEFYHDGKSTYPYYSAKQHLYTVSLAWNFYGGQRDFLSRYDAVKQTALAMDHEKQKIYWASLEETVNNVRKIPHIQNTDDLASAIQSLGIRRRVGWKLWLKLLKKARLTIFNQKKIVDQGRLYSNVLASLQEIALLNLACPYDALTGVRMNPLRSSCDAILQADGHSIANLCYMDKFHNFWKAVYVPFYSQRALEEWLTKSTDGKRAVDARQAGATAAQMIGELLWGTFQRFVWHALDEGKRKFGDEFDISGVNLPRFNADENVKADENVTVDADPVQNADSEVDELASSDDEENTSKRLRTVTQEAALETSSTDKKKAKA